MLEVSAIEYGSRLLAIVEASAVNACCAAFLGFRVGGQSFSRFLARGQKITGCAVLGDRKNASNTVAGDLHGVLMFSAPISSALRALAVRSHKVSRLQAWTRSSRTRT